MYVLTEAYRRLYNICNEQRIAWSQCGYIVLHFLLRSWVSTCWSIAQLLLDVCVHFKAKQDLSKGWKGRPSPSPSVKMKRNQYSKKDDYDGKKIADLQIIWVSLKQERSQQLKTSDLLPQPQQQRNWSYDCFSLIDRKKRKVFFRQHIQSLIRSLPQVDRSNSKETSPVMKETSRIYCEAVKSHINVYTHNMN